jgi:hypothetical protein
MLTLLPIASSSSACVVTFIPGENVGGSVIVGEDVGFKDFIPGDVGTGEVVGSGVGTNDGKKVGTREGLEVGGDVGTGEVVQLYEWYVPEPP